MMKQGSVRFTIAWVSLMIIGVAIVVFGLIVTVWPGSSSPSFLRAIGVASIGSSPSFLRAIGVASIGMGVFGVMITVIAYRRAEQWAWFTLWHYPVFWLAHFLGGLPPGQDHIHQIVFIVLSLVGLLLPISEFFPRSVGRRA
jgi:hypothetical protein